MRKNGHRCWTGNLDCVRYCLAIACFFLLFAKGVFAGDFKSAAIMKNGRIVFSYNAERKLPPASTIKVATALYILRSRPDSLDSWVRISASAAATEPSKAYLAKGDNYRVKDLIKAMLVASSNDAAVALAQWHSGSEAVFVKNLTRFLRQKIGLKNTAVKKASGLPSDGQYSTTRDLCKLMFEASKERYIIISLRTKVFSFSSKKGKKHRLINHNKLLWNKRYRGVVGKTGYTKRARQCFVGLVWYSGKPYTFAMLGGRTLWNNIKELVRIAYENRD